LISVTRCYGFPAAHVLRQPGLSDAENERLYGKCSNGHGHNYGLEVTVTGPVDPRSGEIVAPGRLDAIVRERVLERFGHRLLNDDVCFQAAVPTAENVALAIHRELAAPVAREGARLRRVRVIETRRNSFEYEEAR
jgi:6-pyruvoyltetrahydropterin/6-carboxytetrahydropterin synthase